MINKLVIKFLILILFFVDFKVDANNHLYQEKSNRENPYLNKSKLSKQIKFDELSKIIKKNNQEYKEDLERFNQSDYELKATLKLRYPTIDLQSNGLRSYLISDEYRNPNFNTSTNFESKQFDYRRPKEDIKIKKSKSEEVLEEKEAVNKESKSEEVIEEKEAVNKESKSEEVLEEKEAVNKDLKENSKVQFNEIISNVNCQNYIIDKNNIYCWDGTKFNLHKN